MPLIEERLTGQIIEAFFATYNALGYGFLESPYSNALAFELMDRGLTVRREVPVELSYRRQKIGFHRLDMVVNDKVVVELKASEQLVDANYRQLLNYLRASGIQVGLLLHYGPSPKFKRAVWTGRTFTD